MEYLLHGAGHVVGRIPMTAHLRLKLDGHHVRGVATIRAGHSDGLWSLVLKMN